MSLQSVQLKALSQLKTDVVLKLANQFEDVNLRKNFIKRVADVNFMFFSEFFFRDHAYLPFSAMHHEYAFREVQNYSEQLFEGNDIKARATFKDSDAAPRGNAKSTWKTLFRLLWLVCRYDRARPLEKFVVIFSNTWPQAQDRLADLKTELTQNELIIDFYGKLEGPVWNEHEIITKNGVRFLALSMGKEVRGLKFGNWRPSLILGDDLENSINVRSDLQRKQALDWFNRVVMKLGGRYTNHNVVGTVLHKYSLLASLLKNPGWTARKYKSILKEPVRKDLWQQWEKLFMNLSDPDRAKTAKAFYLANKEDMDSGAEVLWEESESLYDLQVMRITEGEAAFYSEKQNEPFDPESQIFILKDYEYFDVNAHHQGPAIFIAGQNPLPINSCDLFGWLDPALGGKKGNPDYAALVIVAVYFAKGGDYVFWLDSWAKKVGPDEQIAALFYMAEQIYNTYGRELICGVETNAFQKYLELNIQREIATRRQNGSFHRLTVVGKHQHENKAKRILTLQPKLKHGWIKINNAIPDDHLEFLELFSATEDSHDDIPDALEGAVRLATGNRNRYV